MESAVFPECAETEEIAKHVFFVCPRFADARRDMMAASSLGTTVDNIVRRMCQNYNIWCAVSTAASQIDLELQNRLRAEQTHEGLK